MAEITTSFTVILEPDDRVLVTSYNEGGIGIHNIDWAIQMNEMQAADLYQKIGFNLGLNGPQYNEDEHDR